MERSAAAAGSARRYRPVPSILTSGEPCAEDVHTPGVKVQRGLRGCGVLGAPPTVVVTGDAEECSGLEVVLEFLLYCIY